MKKRTLKIPRPSDYHTHLRSPAQVGNELFDMIVHQNCAHYRYVVVEPNTYLDKKRPDRHIETADDVAAYRNLVLNSLGESACTPLFLIKLTPRTTPSLIREAKAAGAIGLKLYPEGVTTGSQHGGVSDFSEKRVLAAIACAEEEDLALQIHPEMPDTFCLIREYRFHDVIREYAERFPRLRLFVEHVTDHRTVKLVDELHRSRGRIWGSITGHHLRLTLDDVLGQVDHHCWPCAKTPGDRDALVLQALIGNEAFISITDSAPHEWKTKHDRACACAGVYNPAHIAIPSLACIFDECESLVDLPKFAVWNGLRAYDLMQDPDDTLTLVRKKWTVPSEYESERGVVTPFHANTVLPWRIAD